MGPGSVGQEAAQPLALRGAAKRGCGATVESSWQGQRWLLAEAGGATRESRRPREALSAAQWPEVHREQGRV